MSMVGSTEAVVSVVLGGQREYDALSDVNYNSKQIIQAICVIHIVYSIKQAKFEGESNSIRKLDVPAYIFLVFESFQVQRKYIGKFLDFHPIHMVVR
jgi:hypothetical protein